VLIAGGIGITPVRALVEASSDDGDVVIYRALRDDELVLRGELDELGVDTHYVVGDHAAPGGERLLSPAHLLELVPDLVDRDVYVCGPPGMTDVAVRNVRAAGVPRRHIHVERFAL
jgi:ferredoxin-NADP reductase